MKSMIKFLLMTIISSIAITSCNRPVSKLQIDLSNSDWQYSGTEDQQFKKASVPGSIHMDLLTNDEIPDPYYRDNEKDLQWIGEKDWVYVTEFQVSQDILAKDNVEIQFKGLDTYADVYLNNTLILQADNFFREWNVNAKEKLQPGTNHLRIVFKSSVGINIEKKENSSIPLRDDYVYTRKPAYHYGWDWGPVFITSGIWRPILIEAWDDARILNIQVQQNDLTDDMAQLTFIYEIEANEDIEASLSTECSNIQKRNRQKVELTKGINFVTAEFQIENPKRWWSSGLGEAYLYDFVAKLLINNKVIDQKDEKIGLRTIELVQKPDSIGKSFHFELNGVPVFMKGANYIPQDLFLNRPTEKDYQKVIQNTIDANMNMLRVWGGGFYENDIFYDLCDENGILVWQDFMFACAMYPGDDAFLENVKQEAIQNVKRLRNHACIALWCGNNENYIGWKDWRWSNRFSKEDSTQVWHDYEKLYHDLLPEVIEEYDQGKFYWPSSPLFGWGYPVNTEGDVHYWGIWHAQEPFENFQKPEFIGRFMSEYGFQGCPEMSSVKKFTIEEDLDINSEVMLMHQKHRIGYPVIDKYMDWYYHTPKDFEAYLYVSQIQQAFGMGIAFETHRRSMPHCMGTLYWQINDCYPVTSWSSVDVYGKWKALHYKTRELFKEVLVTPYVEGSNLNIYVVSDRLEPIDAQLELKLYDFSGNAIQEINKNIQVQSNSSQVYHSVDVEEFLQGHSKSDVVVYAHVKTGDESLSQNNFFFVVPKELNLPQCNITVESQKTENGYQITLTSDQFAKDVFLSTQDGEGFFTHNFFDIIPGEPVVTILETPKDNLNIDTDIGVYSLIDSY